MCIVLSVFFKRSKCTDVVHGLKLISLLHAPILCQRTCVFQKQIYSRQEIAKPIRVHMDTVVIYDILIFFSLALFLLPELSFDCAGLSAP